MPASPPVLLLDAADSAGQVTCGARVSGASFVCQLAVLSSAGLAVVAAAGLLYTSPKVLPGYLERCSSIALYELFGEKGAQPHLIGIIAGAEMHLLRVCLLWEASKTGALLSYRSGTVWCEHAAACVTMRECHKAVVAAGL